MEKNIILSILGIIIIVFMVFMCIKKNKYNLFNNYMTDYMTDNKIIEDAEKALTNDLLE